MIYASEAYERSSASCNLIARKRFDDFKKEADKCITTAINFGRWSCCIPCDTRINTLACDWLKTYGYQVKSDFDTVFVDWSDCE